MAKEIKYLTRNDRVLNPIYNYDCLEELFKNADRLKNEKLDFREKIELIKEVVKYCGFINLIENRCRTDIQYKIDFDSETMDALCFYSYSDSAGNIVKIPLFLTGLYSDNALGVLDLSGLDFKNMCLSLENEELPEEMRDVIKEWSNYRNSYFFAMSRIDFSKLDLSKFFEQLYYGPTPQMLRQIDNCNFYGIDMSRLDDKGLYDILFTNCDFSNCRLNINQIIAINMSSFEIDSFNPKSRSNNFWPNKINQEDTVSLLNVLSSFTLEECQQFENTKLSLYFDEDLIKGKLLSSHDCGLTYNEFLEMILLKMFKFISFRVFNGCYFNGHLIEIPRVFENRLSYFEKFLEGLFPQFKELISKAKNKYESGEEYKERTVYNSYMRGIYPILRDDRRLNIKYLNNIPTESMFLKMSNIEKKLFQEWVNYFIITYREDKDKVILGGIEDFETYRKMNDVKSKQHKI